MNTKQFLEKVIESDPSIRFAAVFDRYGTIKEKLQRKDSPPFLSEFDTQLMLREAANSWFQRKSLSSKLGKGHYSMTVYDNLTRITFPLSEDHFLIISQKREDTPPSLVTTVKKLLAENSIDFFP